MDTPPLWIAVLIFVAFVLMSVGIVFLGDRLILRSFRFKERAQPATDTVVEVKEN